MAVRVKTKTSAETVATAKVESAALQPAFEDKNAQFSHGHTDASVDSIIKKRFHSDAVLFMKEKFGLDLYKQKASFLYDLALGRVTEPVSVTVIPQVWDSVGKQRISANPVSTVVSLKVDFPTDSQFIPCAFGEGHRPYVSSYPCHPFVSLAEDEQEQAINENSQNADIKFTENQKMALEAIGISRDRIYVNSAAFPLTKEEKELILSGEQFPYTGCLRLEDGYSLNVAGIGQMLTRPDGTVKTKMWSNFPSNMMEGDALDLLSIRRVGKVELDFFSRDMSGRVITDIDDCPILNDAGRELNLFGRALSPVVGYERGYDESEQFKVKKTRNLYQVSVVNGGLCVSKMRKIGEVLDGVEFAEVARGNKQSLGYHYELSDVKVSGKGICIVGQGHVPFSSEEDIEKYRRGEPVIVKGIKSKDSEGKSFTYDAYVISDNQNTGFPKVFSKADSERIAKYLGARAIKKQSRPRRKAGYRMGM